MGYEMHKVITPSGMQKVCCNTDDKMANVEKMLEYWTDYYNKNWVTDNHEAIDAPEKKVKWLLDGLANVLLYNNSTDVVTPYKAKRNKEKEVPLSTLLDSQERLIAYKVQPVIWQHLSFMIG